MAKRSPKTDSPDDYEPVRIDPPKRKRRGKNLPSVPTGSDFSYPPPPTPPPPVVPTYSEQPKEG